MLVRRPSSKTLKISQGVLDTSYMISEQQHLQNGPKRLHRHAKNAP